MYCTDTTPLGILSKVSQVTLSSTTRDQTVQNSQRLNLLGGALTNIGGSQACGMFLYKNVPPPFLNKFPAAQ